MRLSALLAWLLLGPGVAFAQDGAPGRCARLAASMASFGVVVPDGGTAEEVTEGCRFGPVQVRLPIMGYEASTVVTKGLPFRDDAPNAARVEARGIRFAPHTGRAKTDWMIRQQQVSTFNLVVDFDYDPSTGHLALHELSLDGELIGRVSLEGVFEGMPGLGMAAAMPQSASVVGVRAVRVRLDSRRFMANYVLPAVAGMLPDADFVETFERGRAMAAAAAAQFMTAAQAGPEDTNAVLALIRDVPQPKHAFEFSFQAGAEPVNPLAVEQALATGVGLAALLAGSRASASYAGAAR